MTLFSRASAQEILKPAERACLTFFNTLWVSLVVVAYPIVVNTLDTIGRNGVISIDWRAVLQSVIQILAISLGMAIRKFFTAQSDNPLPGASPSVYINPSSAPTVTTTATASTETLAVTHSPSEEPLT
jgi:hypothetical protein